MTLTETALEFAIEHQQYWPAVAAGALLFSVALLAFNRLYLSPLAKFPGSKWTALTGWVEVWYDVFLGGQFTFKIEEWHKRYGPIIRINPWEVHISDADYYETLYAHDSHYIKIDCMKDRLGISQSTFETIGHEHHKIRRSAIAPFFSRQSIMKFCDFIQNRVDRICERLDQEYAGTGKLLQTNEMWATLTADVVMMFTFATEPDFVECPDFVAPFTSAIYKQARNVHVMGHFPWLLKFLESLPRSLVGVLSPTMKPVFEFHNAAYSEIRRVMDGEHIQKKLGDSQGRRTIFHEILESSLPPQEKTFARLSHESSAVIGAGIDTTKTVMSYVTFYVLNNPAIYKKVVEELTEAIPDPNQIPSLPKLEALPYFAACINEAQRLSFGIAQRISRISPHKPIQYKDWTIPAGARFGMSAYLTHRDPEVFPEPETFRPERWLGNPQSPSGRSLERYICTFGKGPRLCLGINLAKAEMYIGLATLFRRHRLTLAETSVEDVRPASEFMIPMPVTTSKGVRAIVHRRDS